MKKYKDGEIVTVCVTGIEKYGIFVKIDEQYNGLIHISEITSSYVKNIHDYAKIGEMIKAKVLGEEKKHKIKLSIKDMEYRCTKKNNIRIEETKNGFSTIFEMRKQWVNSKFEEIKQKKLKK